MPSLHKLAGLKSLTSSMDKIQPLAVDAVKSAKLPDTIKNAFPKEGITVGTLPESLQNGLGFKDAVEVRLSIGSNRYGWVHNWRHHKDVFTDTGATSKLLSETIGNPNARCVTDISHMEGRMRQLIVVHNPESKAYCVMQLAKDGKTAELVSWHRSGENYGNSQWSKN